MLPTVPDLADILALEEMVLQDKVCHLPHDRPVLTHCEILCGADTSRASLHKEAPASLKPVHGSTRTHHATGAYANLWEGYKFMNQFSLPVQ